MCGRFANAQSIPQYRAAVREQLPEHRDPTPAPDADEYTPSHNVAPQTRCPVVRRELSWERDRRLKTLENPTEEDRKFQMIIQTMRWGLIPRFQKKQPSYAEAYKTINARDDTILSPQRSMWHPLLPSQRCVVFVQGFYEWQKRGSGDGEKVERIPHFVGMTEPGHGRDDKTGKRKRLMPLAGLYERVRFDGEDKPLYTFTIVTTASNDQLGFLHDRMPVILPTSEAIATWLGLYAEPRPESAVKKGEKVEDSWGLDVAKLLRPLKSELECYKVPKEVGKVGNSDPSFILPVEERKDGLKAFFNKQKQLPTKSSTQRDTTTKGSSTAVKKEEEQRQLTQDSDSLIPSSFSDTQALLAAQEAEDEAAFAEAAAKAEQEEQDRKLAERMQREFEASQQAHQAGNGVDMSRSESIVNLGDSSQSDFITSTHDAESKGQQNGTVKGEEIGDGFAVPKDEAMPSEPEGSTLRRSRRRRSPSEHGDEPGKRACEDSQHSPIPGSPPFGDGTSAVEPSSRFSPDQYNPPLSPPRPRGGYSRKLSPASGGGVHVNPPRGKNRDKPRFEPFPQAPPHTCKSEKKEKTERGPMDEALKKQRKIAEAAREEEEKAWRELSPSRAAGGSEDSQKEVEKGMKSPVRKKTAEATGSASGSPQKNRKGAGADIRSFFSPQKK